MIPDCREHKAVSIHPWQMIGDDTHYLSHIPYTHNTHIICLDKSHTHCLSISHTQGDENNDDLKNEDHIIKNEDEVKKEDNFKK